MINTKVGGPAARWTFGGDGAVVSYTDNETWAGTIHPHQALRRHREFKGTDARLAVVGMTATEVTIADPSDAGMLDVACFDSAAPGLLSGFSGGRP